MKITETDKPSCDPLIILVHPPISNSSIMSMPPLGIISLGTYLTSMGVRVRIVDLANFCRRGKDCIIQPDNIPTERLVQYYITIQPPSKIRKEVQRLLEQINPGENDIVGFSILTFSQYATAVVLARALKLFYPKVKIVFGGQFMTLMGHFYFYSEKAIDYVVTGSGELSLLSLYRMILSGNDTTGSEITLEALEFPLGLDDFRISSAKQEDLAKRTLDIQKTLLRHAPSNLLKRDLNCIKAIHSGELPVSDLPTPSFDLCDLEQYKQRISGSMELILPYQTQRGCSNSCAFCTHPLTQKHELKSINKIASDLAEIKALTGARRFFFSDSSINCTSDYLLKLCYNIKELGLQWGAFTRISGLDDEVIREMALAGCCFVFLGIESGSNPVLRRMNKRIKAEDSERVLRTCSRYGIATFASFIVGFPGERDSDLKETLDFIVRNSRYIQEAGATALMLDLGSGLHMNAERFSLRSLRCDPTAVVRKRSIFSYITSEGDSWPKIQDLIDARLKQLQRVVYQYVTRRNYPGTIMRFLPFALYRFLLKYEYDRKSFLGQQIFIIKKLTTKREERYSSFARIFQLHDRYFTSKICESGEEVK
ncbi:MAG: radical SAM protein [Candidatus Krumholzibacteriota bacterium]|nr:radical SAM protein [Candidatus Krumholzibacteriota bacterium]